LQQQNWKEKEKTAQIKVKTYADDTKMKTWVYMGPDSMRGRRRRA
jgi:hypothetical protein